MKKKKKGKGVTARQWPEVVPGHPTSLERATPKCISRWPTHWLGVAWPPPKGHLFAFSFSYSFFFYKKN
jgi:hypothetical protein